MNASERKHVAELKTDCSELGKSFHEYKLKSLQEKVDVSEAIEKN